MEETPMLVAFRKHLRETPAHELREEMRAIEEKTKGVISPNAYDYIKEMESLFEKKKR